MPDAPSKPAVLSLELNPAELQALDRARHPHEDRVDVLRRLVAAGGRSPHLHRLINTLHGELDLGEAPVFGHVLDQVAAYATQPKNLATLVYALAVELAHPIEPRTANGEPDDPPAAAPGQQTLLPRERT